MKRFLFAVPPFTGHILPATSITRELVARGHQVVWSGPNRVRQLLPPEVIFEGYSDEWGGELQVAAERGWTGLLAFMQQLVVPLTRTMLPSMLDAIDRHQPDILAVDQQMLGGAVAARLRNVPWATLCSTSAAVTPYVGLFPDKRRQLDDIGSLVEKEFGLSHQPGFPDSPHLLIVYATQGLAGSQLDFPAHYRFVGPVFRNRSDAPEFPWHWLRKRPRIYISLGTIREDRESNAKFFKAAVDGLREFDGQVIISGHPDLIDDPPDHVLIREYLPQVELLKEVDLVITHGGHNTVCEALAHGLPMVVAPIRHDQPEVAKLVESAGAGVRVRYGIITPQALRAAVMKVLSTPSYRQAAGRIKEEFLAAGKEVAAADALEQLANQSACQSRSA